MQNGFILSLYDSFIHNGFVRFVYGQPFSFFSEKDIDFDNYLKEIETYKEVITDLSLNAQPFIPSAPNSPRSLITEELLNEVFPEDPEYPILKPAIKPKNEIFKGKKKKNKR